MANDIKSGKGYQRRRVRDREEWLKDVTRDSPKGRLPLRLCLMTSLSLRKDDVFHANNARFKTFVRLLSMHIMPF